jgi:hypothetical protein
MRKQRNAPQGRVSRRRVLEHGEEKDAAAQPTCTTVVGYRRLLPQIDDAGRML